MGNKEAFEGKVVLDVGAGSGILAIWAAKVWNVCFFCFFSSFPPSPSFPLPPLILARVRFVFRLILESRLVAVARDERISWKSRLSWELQWHGGQLSPAAVSPSADAFA